MSVLENLRNLGESELQENLNMFKIKSTGSIEKDIHNLNDFYFENIETLYNYLPICTYKYLETALKENSEKILKDEFENIWILFEDLGLSDVRVSDMMSQEMYLINKYIEDNNLGDSMTDDVMKEIEKVMEKKGFIQDKNFDKNYFEAIDKKFAETLFKFLEVNVEIRKKESYILKLINGIVKIHGSLDDNEIFKVLKKLEIDLNNEQVKEFINFKIPNSIFENNEALIIINKDIADYIQGDFIKNSIKEIYPLETYLKA